MNEDAVEGDSVLARVWRNRRHSRQVSLRENYTTDELIEALSRQNLSQEQALELENLLLNIPDKD